MRTSGRILSAITAEGGLLRTQGVRTLGRPHANETGWFPAKGSYEEAVLSWQEQIERSFRRRELAAEQAPEEEREAPARESDLPRAARE